MEPINLFLLAFTFAGLLSVQQVFAQSHPDRRADFDANWRFQFGDVTGAKEADFADKPWRQLDLSHDWSIEGAFNNDNPAGVDGGALPGGIEWYRKTFTLSEVDKNKSVFIDFDEVYMNSDAWLNRHLPGNLLMDKVRSVTS